VCVFVACSVVMPDNRTVYSTDDGSNGVLLMFKADKPSDLSSGVCAGVCCTHTLHRQYPHACVQKNRLSEPSVNSTLCWEAPQITIMVMCTRLSCFAAVLKSCLPPS
jgi:hypothetical protein